MRRAQGSHDPEPSTRRERTVEVRTSDLNKLADRIGRLGPSHRDPERFHVEKSEIEVELRQLARR